MTKKTFPKIDTDDLYFKLKSIVDASLAQYYDKNVSRKIPLEQAEVSNLSKFTQILISIQKDERDERLSQADSSDNPFNVANLKLLQATTTPEELLRLAASDDE